MNAMHVFLLLTIGSFHLTTRKMYNGLNIIRQQQISSKYAAWQRVSSFTEASRAFFPSLIKPSFSFLLYFLSLFLSRAFYRFGPGISKN